MPYVTLGAPVGGRVAKVSYDDVRSTKAFDNESHATSHSGERKPWRREYNRAFGRRLKRTAHLHVDVKFVVLMSTISEAMAQKGRFLR